LDADRARDALAALADPVKARFLAGFFKTGKGQYAEGDKFLGIAVPSVRAVAKRFRGMALAECGKLLRSEYNEARLLALILMADLYQKGGDDIREAVFESYLEGRQFVNNWNLVDASAPNIAGAHLLGRSRAPLYELVKSKSLWDRRVAIVATFAFIRQNDFADTLEIARQLLGDREDLIHKACGWMLREAGKRDQPALEIFLRASRAAMPRTMLRYAIERFPAALRQAYMR
jgi:3-methyladenine DNA glycosylase AlkD